MSDYDPASIKQRIRSAALWPGIAAALMLGFTYSSGGWAPGSIQTVGQHVFVYTLKFGGWTMAAAALWLLTGMRPALAFDAVAAVIIGVLFVLSGVLMFSSGGMQPIIDVIFGAMFIGSGRQNWRQYVLLGPAAGPGQERRSPDGYDPQFGQRYAAAQQESPSDSLAGRLMQRSRDQSDAPAEPAPPSETPATSPTGAAPALEPYPPTPDPPHVVPPEPPPVPGPQIDQADPADDGSTPDGFLAQFAEKKDPPDESA